MELGYKEIGINPLKPVKQAGFMQQTKPISLIHDDLYARIIGFRDSKKEIYLCSLDNLGVKEGLVLQNELTENLRKLSGRQVEVQISCTHDHFAPDATDKTYYKQLYKQLFKALKEFTWIKSRLYISHKHVFFDEVGKSRLSSQDTKNIFLDLFSIYNKEERLGTLLVYNCHPTILSGDTDYFSSEYPGYVIKKLKESCPKEFFLFFQGAAGDISSRFTRKSQDYSSVIELGDKLVHKVQELLAEKAKKTEIENIVYEKHLVKLENEIKQIDMSLLPKGLTEREKETISIGIKLREEFLKSKKPFDQEILISKLKIGGYNLIFSPKEMFSSYISALDTSKSALVCYTNGYSPYMVDIGFHTISYEMFTDATTEETKERIFRLLQELGK